MEYRRKPTGDWIWRSMPLVFGGGLLLVFVVPLFRTAWQVDITTGATRRRGAWATWTSR